MSALPHQPFYCEENAWHACAHPPFAARNAKAVFVGSAAGGIVMWHQRAAPRAGAPVSWDYHVIVLLESPWEVWDADSTLGAPVLATTYLERSFPYAGGHPWSHGESPRLRVPARMAPRFRVVEGPVFLEHFASDRSHMRNTDGRYTRPPPAWPPIGEGQSNLARFIDVETPYLGELSSFQSLSDRVSDRESRLPP